MTDRKSAYALKLLDPRWQKKRLLILERDQWKCVVCGNGKATLHVHHWQYEGADPWDTPDEWLSAMCADCHRGETELRRESEIVLIEACKVERWPWRTMAILAKAILRGVITRQEVESFLTREEMNRPKASETDNG